MKSKKPLIIAIIVILLLILGAIVFAIVSHQKKTKEYEDALGFNGYGDSDAMHRSLSMYNQNVSSVDAEIRAEKD